MNEDSGAPIGGINKSTKPYIVRALHEWALDQGMTPQIVANANLDNVNVPMQYVNNGRIVLNVHPDSVRELVLENSHISFYARFSGKPHLIYLPMDCVMAIFARENGQGIAFPTENAPTPPPPPKPDETDSEATAQDEKLDAGDKKPPPKRPSHLKLIK